MISFVSFILVLVGCLNWLSIGILQFDFVAGIFGSQANLFSRVVYVIIGAAAIWLAYAVIKQKGRVYVSTKNNKDKKLVSNITNMGKDNKDN